MGKKCSRKCKQKESGVTVLIPCKMKFRQNKHKDACFIRIMGITHNDTHTVLDTHTQNNI